MVLKYLGFVFRIAPVLLHRFFRIKKYAKKKELASIEKRYEEVRTLIQKINHGLHLDVHVQGLENLPKERCYLSMNHQSILDPLVFIGECEKVTSFVAKVELEKAPFVGYVMKAIDCEFMDRDDLRQSLQVMKRVRESFESEDKIWGIFPEGTRNKTLGKKKVEPVDLQEYKHGTFKIPLQTGVPVVPVVIYGSWRVLKPFRSHHRRYPIELHILPPIYKEEYENMNSTQLCEKVYDLSLREMQKMKEENKKHMSELKRKKVAKTSS